ncbi:MAG: sensor domain-containing diguanylate cyclase, partial [Spirochaetes bacterium]|nr:sensor domain-containing diguanylate cyclase [Spirochaetota bacterium]
HKRNIKGIIALGQKMNQEHFSQSEKEIFSLLTHFISVAFSNSILYQKMELSSITDNLTGLYNYRFFKKRLYDEMLRAKRYEHSLSLIFFDADNFKNYNDTLGHPAGDRALKKIAGLVKSSIRKSDIAVRYGGEEFCIILPEEDIQAARIFGERLRKKIEDCQFFKEEVQPGGKLTVSLGEATYPEDAESMQDLIDKADAAMYQAKNRGKNRICLYSENAT